MINEVLYDSHARLLNFGQEKKLPYGVASGLINKFHNATKDLLEKPQNGFDGSSKDSGTKLIN